MMIIIYNHKCGDKVAIIEIVIIKCNLTAIDNKSQWRDHGNILWTGERYKNNINKAIDRAWKSL